MLKTEPSFCLFRDQCGRKCKGSRGLWNFWKEVKAHKAIVRTTPSLTRFLWFWWCQDIIRRPLNAEDSWNLGVATIFNFQLRSYTAARRGKVLLNVRVGMAPRDGQVCRWGNWEPEKLNDLTNVTRCIRGQSTGVDWQHPQLSWGVQISASYLALLPVERASPSTWAPTASFPTWVLQGPGTPGLQSGLDLRVRTRGQPLSFSPLFPPLPISYRPRGGGTPEEPELGLSQWADGPRARPLPSLRRCPIEIYYNVVATRAGGARAGGLAAGRAGLASRREGGRARAEAARSLTCTLPSPVG